MVVVPKLQPRKKDVILRVRLDTDLKGRLDEVCKATGQTMSAAARFLLVAGLEAHEKDKRKR